MDNLDRANRSFVLSQSLYLEQLASRVIAELLGVKREEAATLGNTSKAISFNTKIDLLMDLGALDKVHKAKFVTFMEIRNQFMHNYDAVSFTKCLDLVGNGKAKWLLKEYPQDQAKPLEEQLRNSFSDLSKSVMDLTISIFKVVEERNRLALGKDIDSIAFAVVPETVNDVVQVFNSVINKMIDQGKMDVIKLRNVGDEFGRMFNQVFKERFDEAVKEKDLVTERLLKNIL